MSCNLRVPPSTVAAVLVRSYAAPATRRAPLHLTRRTMPVTPATSWSKLRLNAPMAASLNPLAFILASNAGQVSCEGPGRVGGGGLSAYRFP